MNYSINFMAHRKLFLTISVVFVLLSLIIIPIRGFNLSIDFTGGNVIQVELSKSGKVPIGEVRGIVNSVLKENASIQESGETFMIRIQDDSESARISVVNALRSKYPDMEIHRFEKVGPVVGAELRRDAFIGVIVALIGILIYITFRFQFRFAVISVLGLIHDTIIVLGAFSLFGMEVNYNFIAAILTVVGYSLNNTIIIFDRIRENWKYLYSKKIVTLVNESVNQTLSRTINTTISTFFPVIMLFLWGDHVLASFSFAFIVGISVGTYNSVCVLTSLTCEWWLRKPIV